MENKRSEFVVGVILAFCTASIYGFAAVLSRRILVEGVDPSVALFARMFWTAVVTIVAGLAVLPFSKDKSMKLPPWYQTAMVSVGRVGASYLLFLGFAVMLSSLAMSLYKFSILFIFLFSLLLKPSSIVHIKWLRLCVGFSLIGCSVYLFASIDGSSGPAAVSTYGVLVMLAAGILWAVYSVGQQYLGGTGVSGSTFAQRMFAIGSVQVVSTVALLAVLLYSGGLSKAFSGPMFLPMVVLGCLSGVVTMIAYEGIRRCGAFMFSMIVTLEIPFTMLFETVWLKVDLPVQVVLGGILIIVASILVSRESRRLV